MSRGVVIYLTLLFGLLFIGKRMVGSEEVDGNIDNDPSEDSSGNKSFVSEILDHIGASIIESLSQSELNNTFYMPTVPKDASIFEVFLQPKLSKK